MGFNSAFKGLSLIHLKYICTQYTKDLYNSDIEILKSKSGLILDLSGLELGPMTGSCEQINEPSISIKYGELGNLQRQDRNIAPLVIRVNLNYKRARYFVKIIINEFECCVLTKFKLTK